MVEGLLPWRRKLHSWFLGQGVSERKQRAFPEHMLYIENIYLNEDHFDEDIGEETEGISGDPDSSDKEWIPEFHDTLESGDSDFEEDDVDEPCGSEDGLDSWCM